MKEKKVHLQQGQANRWGFWYRLA